MELSRQRVVCVWVCVCQGDGVGEEVGLHRLAGVLEVEGGMLGKYREQLWPIFHLLFQSFSSLHCLQKLRSLQNETLIWHWGATTIQQKVIKRWKVNKTANNLRSKTLFTLTVNQQETFFTVIHTNAPLFDLQPLKHLGLLKLRISGKECSVYFSVRKINANIAS